MLACEDERFPRWAPKPHVLDLAAKSSRGRRGGKKNTIKSEKRKFFGSAEEGRISYDFMWIYGVLEVALKTSYS